MRTWRCYLEGVNADMLTVVTDHNPLIYLQLQSVPSRRQTRWSEYLQMFTFKRHYRPGKSNVADPLSRNPGVCAAMLPVAGPELLGMCAAVTCKGSNQQLTFRWRASSSEAKVSPPLCEVRASVAAVTRRQVSIPTSESGNLPASESAASDSSVQEAAPASAWSQFQKRCAAAYEKDPLFRDESLLAQYTNRHGLWWAPSDKLVVPDADSLRQDVIHECHDVPHAGHTGVKKTRKAIERHYTWPSLKDDVAEYVRSCAGCQRNKSTNQKPAGLLQPLPVPTRKWGSVSMDLITALPETASGNTAIVVFVDRLSKMTHLAACKTTIDAQAFAKLLRHEFIRLHGIPYEFVSDRDGRFTSSFMREVCHLLNIKQAMSTAYHPQSDGQTERANRVLEEMLRQYVSPNHDDWDEHLDMAEFAINDAWQESVKETPFMLNYGQHPLKFLSLQTHSHVPAAEEFAESLSLGTQRAKDCLQQAQQRQKAYADRGRREVTFDVGEQVLLNTKYLRSRTHGTPKLMPRWIGPYEVLERIGTVAFKLDLLLDMQKYPVFHVSLLQPWISSGRLQPPPPRLLPDGHTVWTVDRIIDHRVGARKNLWEFLIRWEGYGEGNDSWEPEAYIHDPQLVQDYWDYVASREQHTKQLDEQALWALACPLHVACIA